MNDIGLAIIDVYEQENLNSCLDSIKDKVENIFIVSNTNNHIPNNYQSRRFTHQIPFATLRNVAINHFRTKGIKHIFLINSNIIVKDKNLFENTINTANAFGVWFFLGPSKLKLSIEDDENNAVLNLTEDINSDFIYIFSNIIKKVGFFDERCFNTKSLDVLDYIIRLRQKNIYPPTGYISFISQDLEENKAKIKKPNHQELNHDADKSVNMAYAYFFTTHKYIPTQNDPPSESNEKLMEVLKDLQYNYSKKL
jgi:hypothetical protein